VDKLQSSRITPTNNYLSGSLQTGLSLTKKLQGVVASTASIQRHHAQLADLLWNTLARWYHQ